MNIFELQEFDFPPNCDVIKHDFYTYDFKLNQYDDNSSKYLYEDLLQVEFKEMNLIVDLGWYQNTFKIFVVKNSNWEEPLRIEKSKSQKSISEKFQMILTMIQDGTIAYSG